MAAERTSLSHLEERDPEGPERDAETLPAARPAERMRELLPAIEPERRLNDWGRSERIEGIFDQTLVEFFYLSLIHI